jgi:Spy/CpxP family protein refolding chaperone
MHRRFVVTLTMAAVLAGCGSEATAPQDTQALSLVPEFALSAAADVDGAGIGGSRLPESLALTAEQKAAIAELHEAFRAATAADVAALAAIEAEARAARAAGKSSEEIRAILARAQPILARLRAAFEELQASVWEIYTAEQQAWIEAHRPARCDPPRLTDEQIQQIRALQQAFWNAVKDDIAFIRSVVQEAREALAAGATREEIAAILARADAAKARVRQAAIRLQEAIDEILTPDQRRRRCVPSPAP